MNVNKVILIGFIAKDPEVKEIAGKKVATLSLPTSRRYQNSSGAWEEETQWHTVECWGKTAEIVEKYVKKGSQLFVEGELRYRTWESADGRKNHATGILANRIEMLSSKSDNSTAYRVPEDNDLPTE